MRQYHQRDNVELTKHIDVTGCEHIAVNIAGVALDHLQVGSVTPTVLTQIEQSQLTTIARQTQLWRQIQRCSHTHTHMHTHTHTSRFNGCG